MALGVYGPASVQHLCHAAAAAAAAVAASELQTALHSMSTIDAVMLPASLSVG